MNSVFEFKKRSEKDANFAAKKTITQPSHSLNCEKICLLMLEKIRYNMREGRKDEENDNILRIYDDGNGYHYGIVSD